MSRIETLEEAAAYLEGLINHERDPAFQYRRLGLEPVRALLARLEDPQSGLTLLHVAGSKGKGSTALFAEALLRGLGSSVGTFTSPHLSSWTERFRVDGQPVEGSILAASVARLRPEVDALRESEDGCAPTFFDVTTALALLLFREAGVERAILEVGLGGRLDSTNVVEPSVTCITSIELEHTDKLGDTLEAIAAEKAGIVKPGVPCVMGPLPAPAARVVENRCREQGAPLLRMGRDFEVAHAGSALEPRLAYRAADGFEVELALSTPGLHQVANAGLALAAVRQLVPGADEAMARAAQTGLAAARLPGRIEILEREPWVVVDGAHTAASARALAEVLAELPTPPARRHLVLSVSAGKSLGEILQALAPHAGSLTLTRAEARRSLDPAEVATAARVVAPEADISVVPNPHLALRAAREVLGPDDLLCAAGSVYLAGIAREVLALKPAGAASVLVSRRSDSRAPR